MQVRSILGSILLLLAPACSGGGTGSDVVPGGSGSSSNLLADFSPERPNPVPKNVTMAKGGASGPILQVEVRVTPTNDVFGAAFDVLFDETQLQFVSHSPGSMLETGGNNVEYLVSESGPGHLIVSASILQAGAAGVDVSGTKPLIRLTFSAAEAGSSEITFDNGALLNDHPPGPAPITGVTWYGGTAEVE